MKIGKGQGLEGQELLRRLFYIKQVVSLYFLDETLFHKEKRGEDVIQGVVCFVSKIILPLVTHSSPLDDLSRTQ